MWSTITETNLNWVLSLQKQAVRAVWNILYTVSTTPYFSNYNILTIKPLLQLTLSLKIMRQCRTSRTLFEENYQTKQTPYELHKGVITKSRSRTNYGLRRLATSIPDLLSEHLGIATLLQNRTSPTQFEKSKSNLSRVLGFCIILCIVSVLPDA